MMEVDATTSNIVVLPPTAVTSPAVAVTPTTTTTTTRDVFIVQKCWYSGPMAAHENSSSAMDYLRILPTRSCAEEVALLSAHAYANANAMSSYDRHHPHHHHTNPVVTILLPNGGGYGFVTRGRLFWTRCVHALYGTTTTTTPHATSGTTTTPTATAAPDDEVAITAHAWICHNVIGGTGNVHSRRGTEAVDGCVMIGSPSVVSQWALSQSTSSSSSSSLCRTPAAFVTWISWGPPPPAHDAAFWKEWPDYCHWNNNNNNVGGGAGGASNNNNIITIPKIMHNVGLDELPNDTTIFDNNNNNNNNIHDDDDDEMVDISSTSCGQRRRCRRKNTGSGSMYHDGGSLVVADDTVVAAVHGSRNTGMAAVASSSSSSSMFSSSSMLVDEASLHRLYGYHGEYLPKTCRRRPSFQASCQNHIACQQGELLLHHHHHHHHHHFQNTPITTAKEFGYESTTNNDSSSSSSLSVRMIKRSRY
jgi:hypothetical protein